MIWIEVCLSFALFAACFWAITAPNGTKNLYSYFLALLFATAVLESLHLWLGVIHTAFLWAYAWFTVVILLIVVRIGVDFVVRSNVWVFVLFTAFVIATWLTKWAAGGLPHPLSARSWVYLGEAWGLIFAGICVGFSIPFTLDHDRMLCKTLSVMWLTQALWRIEFALHIRQLFWKELNIWVPYMISVPALAWLGWKLREPTRPPLRPQPPDGL